MSSSAYLRRKGIKKMHNRPKEVNTNAVLEEEDKAQPDTRGKDSGSGTPQGTREVPSRADEGASAEA